MDRRKFRFETFPQEDRITVRLRHGDRQRFQAIAYEHGMTMSEFLRDCAEIAIEAFGEPSKVAIPKL